MCSSGTGSVSTPAHGKSSFTGPSLTVIRIQPSPADGPARKSGDVSEVQPVPIAKATFFTAHSWAQSSWPGHWKLSFQSPSRFQSTSTLRYTVRGWSGSQLVTLNVTLEGEQAVNDTAAAIPASFEP